MVKWTMVDLDLPENKGLNPWVVYARDQVLKYNNCVNLVLVGKPGSGKSWALLSYFYEITKALGKDFNLDWLSFKASKFMRRVSEETFSEPGTLLGLDEGGVDLSNMSYFDKLNKGMNMFLQTGRHRNYLFGITVPYLSLLSKGVRMMMLCEFEAMGWKNNKTIVKPRILQYNSRKDKIYTKRLIVKQNGKLQFCNKIELPKPPKDIVKEYEALKKQFTHDLFENLVMQMEADEAKKEAELRKTLERPLTQLQQKIVDYLKEGLKINAIAEKMGCIEQAVYAHMKRIEKKGITFHPIKEVGSNKVIKYDVIEAKQAIEAK